jgi:hypothetical protein
MFHSFSRIKHIDLTGNKLRILNCTEFVDLHALFFLNVRSNSISDIVLVFNIYTCLIFPGNLGMYDSWLSEQVADIPLQVQDGLGHSV